MRAFVVFATLFVVAVARPDIGLKLREQGYNYQSPGQSNGGSSGGGFPSQRRNFNGNGGGGGSRVEPSLFQGISSYEAPLVSGSSYNGGGGHGGGHGSSGNGGNFGQSSSGFSSSGSGFGGSSSGNGGFGGSSNGFGASSGGNGGFGGSSNGFGASSGGNGGFGGSSGGFGGSSGGNGGFGGSSSGGFGGNGGGFGQGSQSSSGFGSDASRFSGSSSGFSSGGSGGFGGSSGGGSGGDVTQGQTQVIDISGGGGGGGGGSNVVYKNVVKVGEPIVTKHFYVHEAPEEEETARVEEKVHEIRPQKNYKIIFIKAPSQPSPFSPGNFPAFPQNEEKTIVYVLSKKPEGLGENGEFPTPPPAVTSKPEVFFVKYKTKEEAEQAVAKIQDSFQEGGPGYNSPASFAESLGAQTGGASSSSFASGGSSSRGDDENIDVRGDSGLQAPFQSANSQSQSQGQSGGDSQSEYLPPNKRQAIKRQARRQG